MKNAADIRVDAIALLVEKIREIGAEADRQCKRHREAEKSPGALADFHAFADHREAAALNYALAYRCEQLAEEITGALLFDELDAQDAAAEMTNADVMSGEEMAEYDRAAEFTQDAADEARYLEENAAVMYGDDDYEDGDL